MPALGARFLGVGECAKGFSVFDKGYFDGTFYGGVGYGGDSSVGEGQVVSRGGIEDGGICPDIRGDWKDLVGSDRGGWQDGVVFSRCVRRVAERKQGEVCAKLQPEKQSLAAKDAEDENVAVLCSGDVEVELVNLIGFQEQVPSFPISSRCEKLLCVPVQ